MWLPFGGGSYPSSTVFDFELAKDGKTKIGYLIKKEVKQGHIGKNLRNGNGRKSFFSKYKFCPILEQKYFILTPLP